MSHFTGQREACLVENRKMILYIYKMSYPLLPNGISAVVVGQGYIYDKEEAKVNINIPSIIRSFVTSFQRTTA